MYLISPSILLSLCIFYPLTIACRKETTQGTALVCKVLPRETTATTELQIKTVQEEHLRKSAAFGKAVIRFYVGKVLFLTISIFTKGSGSARSTY